MTGIPATRAGRAAAMRVVEPLPARARRWFAAQVRGTRPNPPRPGTCPFPCCAGRKPTLTHRWANRRSFRLLDGPSFTTWP